MAGMSEAASSNVIDLSRLPPPTVVELLDFDTIRARNVAQLQTLAPWFDATIASDPAVKLLELFSYTEMLLRQDFNDRARQLMIAYATDANLDQLGAIMGVTRLTLDPGDIDQGIAPILESDDDFRRRIVLAPESFSVAGPADAYVFWALSAAPSIADAIASTPAPGDVTVAILSRNGQGTASADEIAEVEAVLTHRSVRPLTDRVTVVSAEIVPFVVDAELRIYIGPDSDVVRAAAETALAAYLARQRRLGRDVARSGILAALHVEGVQSVNLISPAADVAISDTQVGWCAGTDVTVIGNGF